MWGYLSFFSWSLNFHVSFSPSAIQLFSLIPQHLHPLFTLEIIYLEILCISTLNGRTQILIFKKQQLVNTYLPLHPHKAMQIIKASPEIILYMTVISSLGETMNLSVTFPVSVKIYFHYSYKYTLYLKLKHMTQRREYEARKKEEKKFTSAEQGLITAPVSPLHVSTAGPLLRRSVTPQPVQPGSCPPDSSPSRHQGSLRCQMQQFFLFNLCLPQSLTLLMFSCLSVSRTSFLVSLVSMCACVLSLCDHFLFPLFLLSVS